MSFGSELMDFIFVLLFCVGPFVIVMMLYEISR
jgi:hypothetical protein